MIDARFLYCAVNAATTSLKDASRDSCCLRRLCACKPLPFSRNYTPSRHFFLNEARGLTSMTFKVCVAAKT